MADVTVTAIRSLLVNVCVLLVLGGVSLSNGEPAPNKNVICYHHYKSPSYPGVTNYSIADIDPSICTHLVYFYTWVTPSPIETMNSDISHSPEWEKLKSLRLANPSLKIILSLYDYDHVLPTLTYEDRQTSVIYTKDYLRTYGFDGLEYLWYKDISQDLTVFLEEMHAVFAAESTSKYAEPLILMLTVMGSSSHIDEGVDVSRLAEAVDIFHVMSFGYSVSFASKTGLANPLHGTGTNYFDNNVSGSLSYFLDAGMTPEKLHMAVQLKAMTFTLSDPQLTGVGAPAAGKGDPGEHTKVDGKLSYYEVCNRLQQELYTAEMDPEGLVKFAYKGDQWMTYEDIASLKIKMDYVIEHNLGGVAVWFLHEDDYTGQFCNQGRYPLTSALYRLASQ